MGVTSTISIDFMKPVLEPMTIISAFIQHGWKTTYNDGDGRTFTAGYLIGERDDAWDWEWEYPEDWNTTESRLLQRIRSGQIIGFELFLEQSDVQLVIDKTRDNLRVTINRVAKFNLSDFGRITDFSLYLRHILPPLNAYHPYISAICCTDAW